VEHNNKEIMPKEITQSCWPFELDTVHAHAWQDGVFTKKECDKIIEYAKKKNLTKARVGPKLSLQKKIRDNSIFWIHANNETQWIYERVVHSVISLNNQYFKFDIYGLIESLQFTNYKAPGQNYTKHVDRSHNIKIRKLSVSIQLSDPSEYEGGELLLHHYEKPDIASKKQGTLCIFPSWTLHEVKPVTKGERSSLVTWVTGKNFR
tara:strand:+ start:289 stop:906 length:618 start_codon:yes stop_codon:yes gene_type:complete